MKSLSGQERIFAKEVALTDNATQAVVKAYKKKNSGYIRTKAHRLMTKENIIKAVEEIKLSLAEKIPDELLMKVHLEGLQASDKVFNSEGEVILEKPDYAVRHKYLDSGYKLKGSYAAEKQINLNIHAEITNPKARELAEEYESKLKQDL